MYLLPFGLLNQTATRALVSIVWSFYILNNIFCYLPLYPNPCQDQTHDLRYCQRKEAVLT